jgi:hypothetical protein
MASFATKQINRKGWEAIVICMAIQVQDEFVKFFTKSSFARKLSLQCIFRPQTKQLQSRQQYLKKHAQTLALPDPSYLDPNSLDFHLPTAKAVPVFGGIQRFADLIGQSPRPTVFWKL